MDTDSPSSSPGFLGVVILFLGLGVLFSPIVLCVVTSGLLFGEESHLVLFALLSWTLSTSGLALLLNPETPRRSILICVVVVLASVLFYGYALVEGDESLEGIQVLVAALSPAFSTVALLAGAIALCSAASSSLRDSKEVHISTELKVRRNKVSSLKEKLRSNSRIIALTNLVGSCGGDVQGVVSSPNMVTAFEVNGEIKREKEAIKQLLEEKDRLGEKIPSRWAILESALGMKRQSK